MSSHLSHLDTLLALSARHEQEWQNEHDPFDCDPEYYENNARYLHFQWHSDFLAFHDIEYAPLPEVKLGQGRFSKEGVVYRHLYSHDPSKLVFKVYGGQFINLADSNYPADVPEFTFRVEKRECPDGALGELVFGEGRCSGGLVLEEWEYMAVVGCSRNVKLGKPTRGPQEEPDPEETPLKRGGSIRRFAGSVRDKFRKMTGKGKKEN